MISEAIKGFFEGVVKPVLDKVVPDANLRLEAEQAIFKGAMALDLAQIEVNKVEAAHQDWRVAGWRPALGWVCVLSIGYAVIGYTFLNWLFACLTLITGHTVPGLPAPDTTMTFDMVMGMLGLGGMRTYEKLKGLTK